MCPRLRSRKTKVPWHKHTTQFRRSRQSVNSHTHNPPCGWQSRNFSLCIKEGENMVVSHVSNTFELSIMEVGPFRLEFAWFLSVWVLSNFLPQYKYIHVSTAGKLSISVWIVYVCFSFYVALWWNANYHVSAFLHFVCSHTHTSRQTESVSRRQRESHHLTSKRSIKPEKEALYWKIMYFLSYSFLID